MSLPPDSFWLSSPYIPLTGWLRRQDGTPQMVQWLVILVALLLLSNLMMMGMMAYGFAFMRAEVQKANQELHAAMETVNAVCRRYGVVDRRALLIAKV
jgi:hypothetical protein